MKTFSRINEPTNPVPESPNYSNMIENVKRLLFLKSIAIRTTTVHVSES